MPIPSNPPMTDELEEALQYCKTCRCFTGHYQGETSILPILGNNDPATAIDVPAWVCEVCEEATPFELEWP